MPRSRTGVLAIGAATILATSYAAPTQGHDSDGDWRGHVHVVADGFDSPRGVDALGHGRTLVTDLVLDDQGNPTAAQLSLVVAKHHRHHDGRHHGAHAHHRVIELGQIATGFTPDVAAGPNGNIYLLTGADNPESTSDDDTAARLFRWRWGWEEFREVADIGAYQATDPDPHDTEGSPTESNPYGLAALPTGGVLVADAAGNDVLRVRWNGDITTVARLGTRSVAVPEGLPEVPPEQGGPLPPAGTMIDSEAVPTAVAVGADGAWYVSELRGFPGTPGTSQIWRIRAGATDASCDPDTPAAGSCRRVADGLTSVVDLARAGRGLVAVSLSKMGFMHLELGVAGAEVGGLFKVSWHSGGARVREVPTDEPLIMPGGVDTARDGLYVVGPLLGPGGALMRLH